MSSKTKSHPASLALAGGFLLLTAAGLWTCGIVGVGSWGDRGALVGAGALGMLSFLVGVLLLIGAYEDGS